MSLIKQATAIALMSFGVCVATAQEPASPLKLKDEQRMPWKRDADRFLRQWLVVGPFPGGLDTDCLGGESAIQPADGMEQKRADGTSVKWHSQKSWGDVMGFEASPDPSASAVSYAFAKVSRPKAGKVLLSAGSDGSIRVWVNGKRVLARDGQRSVTADEDQIEVDMNAGENTLLVKMPASNSFCVRVLEAGSVVARNPAIGPSILHYTADGFTLKTDIGGERTNVEAVEIEIVAPGGKVLLKRTAPRGATLSMVARELPDGPYDVRCSTRTMDGRLTATHLPWYKGDCLAKARALATTAATADASKPEGFTLKMLAEMVADRLGCKISEAKGDPWKKIHSPLMEYDEMMLERMGRTGRIRPYGFVRLAYMDEVDGTPQYCRAYLPGGYDSAKKWPLVIQMHGYNPANPVYVQWWGSDSRHGGADTEFSNHQGIIYMEPHGRGNASYVGFGDSDVIHAIAEAKRLLNVDEDRVYLQGDSMGGWGTWNISTRHPDLFAAIAPTFGGSDYHVDLGEEDLVKLTSLDRFLSETESSWSMADSLLNIPIYIRHGDIDRTVNVDYSRWGARLLQRSRRMSYPGCLIATGASVKHWLIPATPKSEPKGASFIVRKRISPWTPRCLILTWDATRSNRIPCLRSTGMVSGSC